MKLSKSIRLEIVLAALSIAVVLLTMLGKLEHSKSMAIDVFKESKIVNMTTSIYLFQRAYDTVFEVLVFSIIVSGLSLSKGSKSEKRIDDEVFKFVSKFMGFFIGISSMYLALTGHIYPGGGFTAGVVGGTSLLLMGISRGIDRFESEFERFRVPFIEKILLGIIALVVAILIALRKSHMIPLVNFLIYFKVMAGTWIITHEFIKRRGII